MQKIDLMEAAGTAFGAAADYMRGWNDAVDAMPRWISVEERLPGKGHDWVLIIGKWESGGGWIVPHVAEYREGIWMANGTGWNKIEDLHIKVTHWMPLPEPPEEGES